MTLIARAQRLLKKVPQYTRTQRHVWSVLRHGTPRKWINLTRAEIARKRRAVELRSYPYLLIIDPCNYCNLRCPLCPTGLNDLGRPQAMLSFEHFRKYFDPLAPHLFEAYLHNWGESLLNKEVYRMIEHAQRSNVGTNLSSNFVALDSNDIDKLLDCGLEYLIVSLDGTSQETYGRYRIRGDLERVVENMSILLDRRGRRGQKTPVIEWQYIIMKHNEHEVPEAERLAQRLGVDLLRFIPVGMPFEFKNRKEIADQWYPTTYEGRVASDHREQQYGQRGKPGPCFYLYRSMVVNPDGGVSPCCVVYRKNRDFADLSQAESGLLDVWNNAKYRSARAIFAGENGAARESTVCEECDIFQK